MFIVKTYTYVATYKFYPLDQHHRVTLVTYVKPLIGTALLANPPRHLPQPARREIPTFSASNPSAGKRERQARGGINFPV